VKFAGGCTSFRRLGGSSAKENIELIRNIYTKLTNFLKSEKTIISDTKNYGSSAISIIVL